MESVSSNLSLIKMETTGVQELRGLLNSVPGRLAQAMIKARLNSIYKEQKIGGRRTKRRNRIIRRNFAVPGLDSIRGNNASSADSTSWSARKKAVDHAMQNVSQVIAQVLGNVGGRL